MVGENLRLLFDSVCEFFFERHCDARMQPMPRFAQQRATGRILDKRMLKEIAPLRWRAAVEDETGADKLIECHLQFCLGPLRRGNEKLVSEFSSNRSTNL